MAKGLTKQQAARARVVVLGGREFEVTPLPMGAARTWRKKHGKPLQAVMGVLRSAGKIKLQDDEGNWDIGVAANLLNQVGSLLLGSVDILVDALLEYMALSAKDEEWVLDNGDDIEAMAALWEVLQLAYPFGSLVSKLNQIGRGSMNGTSEN